MSFSSEVKKELTEYMPKDKICLSAELFALISFSKRVKVAKNNTILCTKNQYKGKRFYDLAKKIFHVIPDMSVRRTGDKDIEVYKILIEVGEKEFSAINENLKSSITENNECRRAFLRGAFMAAGSIGDPNKGYHFEVVAQTREKAKKLVILLELCGISAKYVRRKNTYPVYFKEAESLVDFLGITNAGVALMKLENIRIYKEIKNNVNRTVNYETANIKKTALAAAKQLEAINYLKSINELSELPDKLKELAEVRLEYPEATLKELGEFLSTPLSKSGVNHRLKKIEEIVEERRKK